MSIPIFISEDIVGKRFLKLEAVVELLKDDEDKDNLFADFPIGTTMQDGGKRKRSVFWLYAVVHVRYYCHIVAKLRYLEKIESLTSLKYSHQVFSDQNH